MPSSHEIQRLLQQQREQITTRISQLEQIISNPTSGQIVIQSARVELAQLREHQKKVSNTKQNKELADVKEDAIASKLKGKLEYALLKAKEDKVRYELDIHHQLLELRNNALIQQSNAQQRTNKAQLLSNDAISSQQQCEEALLAAQKALEDAKSLNIQRTQNLTRLQKVEASQDKEVLRLHEETTKNEVLIQTKLEKAGLSKKELKIIYDQNDIGKFTLDQVRKNVISSAGIKSGIGDKLKAKSKELENKKNKKNKGNNSKGGGYDPDDYEDEYGLHSESSSQVPNDTAIAAQEFVVKLDIHRTSQEKTLKGFQTEVDKLNDKVSKSQWTELLKLRSRNAEVEDELYSTNEWLKLEQTKMSTLEATTDHQATVIRGLEKDVQDRDARIGELEDNATKLRQRIVNLENVTSKGMETIRLLEGKVDTLEKECEDRQTKINELTKSNTTLRERNATVENDILHQKNTIRTLDLQREKMESLFETKHVEMVELQATCDRYKERINNLENATSGGMEMIRMLESKIDHLTEDCTEKGKRIVDLEIKNSSQRERIVSLENATSGGMETLRILEAKSTSLNTENEANKSKIVQLEETNTNQAEKISSLENSKLHHDNTIRVLDMQRQSFENECDKKQNTIDELEKITRTQSDRILSLENATSGGMEILKSLEMKICSLSTDNTGKANRIEELERYVESQGEKITVLENTGEQKRDTIRLLEVRVESLANENDAKESKICTLEETSGQQVEKLQTMEKDSNRVKDIIRFMEARVNTLEKNKVGMEDKIEDLEGINDTMGEQILSLENENLHQKNTITYLDLQCKSIEEKIASLDANLAEIKTNVVHWHRLTAVMRHELNLVQEKRDLEEANLQKLQRRLNQEQMTLENTKDAVISLDKMKVLLEYRMMVENQEEQKSRLSEMKADTVNLLQDKTRALKALQSIKMSYETAISDKREILFMHHLLEHVHETLIEWQTGMNSSIWAPSEILLACVDHESKTDALRKTQHLRLKALMQTPELAPTSDDDSDDSAPTEVVSDLKRKLAAITAEAEEYKKRAKAELYQLSCRECVDCDLRYVGKTHLRLWSRIDEHFDEFWANRDMLCQECSPEGDQEKESADNPARRGIDHAIVDFTTSPLAKHFAVHCKDVETKEDALDIFHKIVRVERRTVLRTRRVKYVSPSSSIMNFVLGKKKSKGRRQ